jgi:hypothetical protein
MRGSAPNFVVLPVLVAGLIQFLPINPMLRLGVLMVLLTPCIDYVVRPSSGKGTCRKVTNSMNARTGLIPASSTVVPGTVNAPGGRSASCGPPRSPVRKHDHPARHPRRPAGEDLDGSVADLAVSLAAVAHQEGDEVGEGWEDRAVDDRAPLAAALDEHRGYRRGLCAAHLVPPQPP